jgi:hypothetical protein
MPASPSSGWSLSIEEKCQFVAADERFLRKLQHGRQRRLRGGAISLNEAMRL